MPVPEISGAAIERDFGEYVRSELLQSILAGVILGLGLWAMGIQYPILLAIFAALAWLIPWLGGVLAIIPVAIAGFSQSIGLGIFATVFALGVLFFLDFLIEPRFIAQAPVQLAAFDPAHHCADRTVWADGVYRCPAPGGGNRADLSL